VPPRVTLIHPRLTLYPALPVTMLMLANVAFSIRMSQKLSMFEIRRAEADIRTVTPTMIHRITPRFKSLLHECHQCGNTAHGLLMPYAPTTFVNIIQLIGGIFQATMSGQEEEKICVPGWVFAGAFQPVLTTMVFIHGYGSLNLAIERDIDQDIVESKARAS